MQFQAWMENWIIRYLGFDLQNSNTITPRMGLLDNEDAGSASCSLFGSSLIIESISQSNPCFDDVLDSQLHNDQFWHERLETAIHVWDKRHKSAGDWPGEVLREKAAEAEILDELSLKELCILGQDDFSEKILNLCPRLTFLRRLPRRGLYNTHKSLYKASLNPRATRSVCS